MNRLVMLGRLPQLSKRLVATRISATPTTRSVRLMSSSESDADFKPSEELAKERYELRAGEDVERKRARLLYQSRKRGMLENGVILASFADKFLHKLDADHLDQYDRLINLPTNDWDIFYWATKTKPTPAEFETPVMEMLRQHLHSKVSSDEKLSDRVLGKSGLDEVVLPASKNYDLEIKVHEVDLANYKQELFDNRIKEFSDRSSIKLMSDWRKRQIEKRLRRAVSKPISLAPLAEDRKQKSEPLHTQEAPGKDVASVPVIPRNLIDSEYDKLMKHHDVLQNVLHKDLTNNPLEYDDEAEAWANMLWHRNYGSDDDLLTPVADFKCKNCRSKLHCCDPALSGYVPREIFVSIGANEKLQPDNLTCQRCKFSSVYDAKLTHEMCPEYYELFLREIGRDKSALIVILVDLTDFPGSIWENMIDLIDGRHKPVIVVGNKVDLLPYDGLSQINRVKYSLKKNLSKLRPGKENLCINDVTVISARTGFGVARLVTRLLSFSEEKPRNIYILGSDNSGKSTLFSALVQSDLCATRKGDIISRVSKYQLPLSEIRMLQFPINSAEGWEVELKRRKLEIQERNADYLELSLKTLTERRRDKMPHMSTLINRLEYLPSHGEKALVESGLRESPDKPQFSYDHPLANLEDLDPLCATEERFQHNTFCYHTPSAINPDQLHNILTNDERLEVFPNETILPRKYTLRPLQTIFIAGLARLDLLTSQSAVLITIFASKYLPVHVIQTRKADKFYNQFLGTPYLGVPFGDDVRLAAWPKLENSQPDFHITGQAGGPGVADIVLGSTGWALVSMTQDEECILRAYTPEGRGIYMRDPPLLSKAHRSLGKKIRDTPMFQNPNFEIKTRRLNSVEQ